MSYQTILVDVLSESHIAVMTLNRPSVKNALSEQLLREMAAAFEVLESRADVHVIVLTGGEQAFAVGMDILEMHHRAQQGPALSPAMEVAWDRVATCRLPLIAAVAGPALGGGCELAMLCDIIVASETAQFAQPEITLGLMPGAGGTQRLPRILGMAKAMDLCLTGRLMSAHEAYQSGLVSRVTSQATFLHEALSIAQRIASFSRPVSMKIKEAIRNAFELSLQQGLQHEKLSFHALAMLKDPHEGMQAFLEKRAARFEHH